MPGEPEVGDKVSWNYGGGAPAGTVAEKKTEGEIAITSKRGNKIKKNAEADNPAVHVERSGNDVVKKASELNIEKKGSGSKASKKDDKKEDKEDKTEESESKTEKRKHDDEEAEDKAEEPATVENDQGKEVRPGGKTNNKKQKKEKEKEEPAKKADKKEEKKTEEKAAAPEKKKPGRPKKSETKEKKESKPREGGDLVSTRTRSQNK